MKRALLVFVVAAAALSLGVSAGTAAPLPSAGDLAPVVVTPGHSVQIAFANSLTGSTATYAPSLANAVQMAVEAHPTVRGFPIQVNVVNAPCGNTAADVAAANTIAANAQNLAVLGQVCSTGFDQALEVYQDAELTTISASATKDTLPPFGPSVFNRTVVADSDGFASWYASVSALPSDLAWRQAYALEFGTAPKPFADLYYDAAGLLIRKLEKAATVDRRGDLIVLKPLLARAVRHTTRYRGVSCTVTLDPSTGNRLNGHDALANCAGAAAR